MKLKNTSTCMSFVALGCLVLTGCEQVDVGVNAEPVKVSGKLSAEGTELTGVTVNFQPTSGGLPGLAKVTEGKFETNLTPGKYTYFVTPGSDPKSEASIPVKLREASLDRQIEIKEATSSLDLKVD